MKGDACPQISYPDLQAAIACRPVMIQRASTLWPRQANLPSQDIMPSIAYHKPYVLFASKIYSRSYICNVSGIDGISWLISDSAGSKRNRGC